MSVKYDYQPLATVTIGNMDVELSENKTANPEKRYCVYEREDLGMTEQFHRMDYRADIKDALQSFAGMIQKNIRLQQTRQIGASQSDTPCTFHFYCPLTVQMYDYDLDESVEMDVSILNDCEDKLRKAIETGLCGWCDSL